MQKLDECYQTQANIEFQARKLWLINVKIGNSFKNLSQKMQNTYEC